MYHVHAGKSWDILWRVGIEQEATPPGNRCHGLVKVFKERSLYKKCRAGNRWRPLVPRKFRAFALRAPHLLASEKSEIGPPTTNWQLALAKLYDTCDQFSQGKKHFITSRRKTSVTNDLEWFFFHRLERLCPRVRTSAPRPSYDSTSLSSVDTSTLSSSSSDLWNVRAMPDVPFSRLSKPLSLRAGARQRPSHLDRFL